MNQMKLNLKLVMIMVYGVAVVFRNATFCNLLAYFALFILTFLLSLLKTPKLLPGSFKNMFFRQTLGVCFFEICQGTRLVQVSAFCMEVSVLSVEWWLCKLHHFLHWWNICIILTTSLQIEAWQEARGKKKTWSIKSGAFQEEENVCMGLCACRHTLMHKNIH